MEVAQRIRELVKQHGTMSSVAAVCGIDRGCLTGLRSGKRNPTDKVLKKLGLKRKQGFLLIGDKDES